MARGQRLLEPPAAHGREADVRRRAADQPGSEPLAPRPLRHAARPFPPRGGLRLRVVTPEADGVRCAQASHRLPRAPHECHACAPSRAASLAAQKPGRTSRTPSTSAGASCACSSCSLPRASMPSSSTPASSCSARSTSRASSAWDATWPLDRPGRRSEKWPPRSRHPRAPCQAPPPCPAPWCLRPARSHAPRPTSQARQSGYGDNNLGSCLRIPPAYKLWVNDWVGTGQFYLRSSPAALWFVQEVRARTHAARAVCVRRRVAHAWWACVVRMRLRARLRLRVCERVCERDRDHTSRSHAPSRRPHAGPHAAHRTSFTSHTAHRTPHTSHLVPARRRNA